jgi:hypothetical protein
MVSYNICINIKRLKKYLQVVKLIIDRRPRPIKGNFTNN